MGDDDFSFDTYAGKVLIQTSDEDMTPFGGIVPFAAFLKKSGITEALAASCPVVRTSPNAAPIRDVLVSFLLTCLCDGSRFSHVERLRHDPTLPQLLGIKRIVSSDAFTRLFKRIPADRGRVWISEAAKKIWSALPQRFILDWDSTVLTRYGNQEGAVVGYNPQKRGRNSHHPLLAVVAGTRLCPYYRLRPGNSHTAGEWVAAMEECLQWIGRNPWLNRGDLGFCGEEIISWHEQAERPHYLFKLKMTSNVRRMLQRIREEDWQGEFAHGVLQVAEGRIQLSSWSRPRRVVFGRRLQGTVPAAKAGAFWDVVKHEYEAYVTDLSPEEANGWQIVDLYRQRADAENVFDELKNQWGFCGFCSQQQIVTEFSSRLLLLTYNLWNLFMRLLEPGRHVEAIQSRRWFLLMAARMVSSGRERVVKISVRDEWQRIISDGYRRVCQWLTLTAAQLGCEVWNSGGGRAISAP
jgi:hypothetical protein